jgi:6-phosphogluconolactonase
MRLTILPDADAIATAARAAWERHASAAVAARGAFRVLLSGGSTPRRLFHLLATVPPGGLPWDQTWLFWGDERSVGPDHPDSNYRMTREALLDTVGPPAGQVYRLEGERDDLDAAASDYQRLVAGAWGVSPAGPPPAFDLVLLGLGTDAHTASLFPHTVALAERQRWFVANDVPRLATRRLTATYPLLDAAREILFLVSGADKAEALARVRAPEVAVADAPARGVAARSVTWLVDTAAARA